MKSGPRKSTWTKEVQAVMQALVHVKELLNVSGEIVRTPASKYPRFLASNFEIFLIRFHAITNKHKCPFSEF